VHFPLDAPAALAGMPRGTVRLTGGGASAGAVLLYGRGLGAIAVIEHAARGGAGGVIGALPVMLPTARVNGVTATELPTALGTVLEFMRGGVGYVVAGSVPSAVAIAAARGL
jgi:hypothetical protein